MLRCSKPKIIFGISYLLEHFLSEADKLNTDAMFYWNYKTFSGHAMLVGGKHFVTFDKKYYDFRGSCTYLLATDVIDRNFTLLVSYNEKGISNELILLLNKTVIHIDLFKDVS